MIDSQNQAVINWAKQNLQNDFSANAKFDAMLLAIILVGLMVGLFTFFAILSILAFNYWKTFPSPNIRFKVIAPGRLKNFI